METPSRRNNVEPVKQPNTLLETPPSGIEITTPQDIIGNTTVESKPNRKSRPWLKIVAAVAGLATAGGATAYVLTGNRGGDTPQEGTKPAPTETNVPYGENAPKTLDEYITQLEEFQGIESLVLPAADASADKFGQWSVDIYNKASLASCEKVDEIKEAAVNLALSDTPVENEDLYSGIAKANTGNIMKASRGSKWMNDPRSVNWYDQYVKNNIWGIKNCITNTKDQILSKRFISAADLGVNADNHQVYEVKYEVTTGDPNSTLNGERDETYVTDIEDGHIIVLDSAEH